uniref:Uncharacterized protein n=1 Tax=Setaria viridis TaxID=4556 RepID=A0A4U6UD76_SETVI|nr:hypothetical protein SEVIR_6G242025v2 [Setaria viridis]
MLGFPKFEKWMPCSLNPYKLSYVSAWSNLINIGLVPSSSMLRCNGVFYIQYNNFS